MSDEITLCLESMKEEMQNAFLYLEKELDKIRAGKANVKMLDTVKVDYYGTPTPIAQVASLSTPDPKQIVIQPWEKSMIGPIEKAILAANLGFNPQNNGEVVRVIVPALTEERRKELVKKVKQESEQAKISIRNIRRKTNDEVKKLKDGGVPEDETKKAETSIQKTTDEFIAKVDQFYGFKEKEIMTI
ncbi:MAG: ribosome recycling factor [Bacteroidales bacterium]|jgi:ribosome recycling factor|nr:ribosome recycling factor [Bacteroidales bacterium]MBQ6668256.1 ribosome recycling factor [Bacteroidales bacterium]